MLTTRGTGCAPRDVTPEATASVLHKLAPGIVHAMTSQALAHEPHAALSRGIAGIRDRCADGQPAGPAESRGGQRERAGAVLVHALAGSAATDGEEFRCRVLTFDFEVSLILAAQYT